MFVLVFANGAITEGAVVNRTLVHARRAKPFIIAADGGLRPALRYQFTPSLIIGDMDSLTPAELAPFQAAETTLVLQYPAEKNETDLELALRWLATNLQETEGVYIIGGLGGRLDQTIANLYLLALPELSGHKIYMVDGDQTIWLMRPGTHQIEGTPGDTISLIPLGGAVHGIVTQGLYYPLKNETLEFGPARGISNVMQTSSAAVTFHEGLLLLVHTVGHA